MYNLFLPHDLAVSLRTWFEGIPYVFALVINIWIFIVGPYTFYRTRNLWFAAANIVLLLCTGGNGWVVWFIVMFLWVEMKRNIVARLIVAIMLLALIPVIVGGLAVKFEDSLEPKNVIYYLAHRLVSAPLHVRKTYFDHYSTPRPAFERKDPVTYIGENYYHMQWPQHYGRGVKAYASFDADAYARFGPWGVAATVAIFLGMVALLVRLRVADWSLYGLPWIHLLLALPSSSIQAILFAQWFWLWFVILWWRRNAERTCKVVELSGTRY